MRKVCTPRPTALQGQGLTTSAPESDVLFIAVYIKSPNEQASAGAACCIEVTITDLLAALL